MTELLWRNPHVRGRMTVVDDAGEETVWEVELGPEPGGMDQRGLIEEDFFGRVRIAGFLSRRGTNSIGAIHVLLPSRVEFVQGNRELRWSNETVTRTGPPVDPELEAEEKRTAHARSGASTYGGTAGSGSAARPIPRCPSM